MKFCVIEPFQQLHVVTTQSRPGCVVTMSIIEWEKIEMMLFQWCTKFVAALDPGYCRVGAEGSNALRVEAT